MDKLQESLIILSETLYPCITKKKSWHDLILCRYMVKLGFNLHSEYHAIFIIHHKILHTTFSRITSSLTDWLLIIDSKSTSLTNRLILFLQLKEFEIQNRQTYKADLTESTDPSSTPNESFSCNVSL